MKLFRFIKVYLMLGWRAAAFGLILFTVMPGWNGYPALVFGVPLVVAAIIVFGLNRTILVFPVFRLFSSSNPFLTEKDLNLRAQANADRIKEASDLERRQRPSELFNHPVKGQRFSSSELSAEQLDELRAAYAAVFETVFESLERERRDDVRNKERAAGTNATAMLQVKPKHKEALYADAVRQTDAHIRQRYQSVSWLGSLGFEASVRYEHQQRQEQHELDRRRVGYRTQAGVESAAERRAMYEAFSDLVKRQLRKPSSKQLMKLDLCIAQSLPGALAMHERYVEELGDDIESVDEFEQRLKHHRAGIRAEQVSLILPAPDEFSNGEFQHSSDESIFIYSLEQMVPTTRETARALAADHLAERYRMRDGSEIIEIVDRFKY